ncbi:MAG: ATP-binding protein [Syntrophales bacterium]
MKAAPDSLLVTNEKLKTKLEVKNNLLNHVYEISSMLTSVPDLEKVLREIVDRIMTGLNFDRVIIHLINNDGVRLECVRTKGFTQIGAERALSKPLVIGKHYCYETSAILRGEPIFIKDTVNNPEATEVDRIINNYQERKSVLYVPLKLKGKVIGLIGVDRYRTRMEITQDDIESLAIFANQAAIIIENARLYDALSNEKMLSENIIRCSVNGIMVSDLDGQIRNLNPRGEEILGINNEEAKLRLIQDVFLFNDKERLRIYKALKRKEDISPFEITYQRKDNRRLTLGITAFTLTGENGDVHGAVSLITDLTEKKRMDDYLLRTEKLAALGWIASGIAHEIRNPLAGIYTTVQNMENECDTDNSHRGELKNILTEIDRIEGLIREVLNLARPLPLQIEEVDVHKLLTNTVSLVRKEATKKDIVIKTQFSKETMPTRADPNRLRQVFLNLLINAVDSITTKGKVMISTEMMEGQTKPGRWLLIRFKDNGIGIPAEVINKIFDPFFTTKSVGTGLGLTVSDKIIQDHHGIIEVESKVQKGTTFCVRLPVFLDEA